MRGVNMTMSKMTGVQSDLCEALSESNDRVLAFSEIVTRFHEIHLVSMLAFALDVLVKQGWVRQFRANRDGRIQNCYELSKEFVFP